MNFDVNIHVPGNWYCAKCGFGLVSRFLCANTGNTAANNEPQEKCPNCDVPLWRVTWRKRAEDAVASHEVIHARLQESESLVAGAVGAITRLVEEVYKQRGQKVTADIVVTIPWMQEVREYNVKYDRKNDG